MIKFLLILIILGIVITIIFSLLKKRKKYLLSTDILNFIEKYKLLIILQQYLFNKHSCYYLRSESFKKRWSNIFDTLPPNSITEFNIYMNRFKSTHKSYFKYMNLFKIEEEALKEFDKENTHHINMNLLWIQNNLLF